MDNKLKDQVLKYIADKEGSDEESISKHHDITGKVAEEIIHLFAADGYIDIIFSDYTRTDVQITSNGRAFLSRGGYVKLGKKTASKNVTDFLLRALPIVVAIVAALIAYSQYGISKQAVSNAEVKMKQIEHRIDSIISVIKPPLTLQLDTMRHSDSLHNR